MPWRGVKTTRADRAVGVAGNVGVHVDVRLVDLGRDPLDQFLLHRLIEGGLFAVIVASTIFARASSTGGTSWLPLSL